MLPTRISSPGPKGYYLMLSIKIIKIYIDTIQYNNFFLHLEQGDKVQFVGFPDLNLDNYFSQILLL